MNDNNINLDNVLGNLSNNNLPIVLLLFVLVIIVLVIVISDYFLFSRNKKKKTHIAEGFDQNIIDNKDAIDKNKDNTYSESDYKKYYDQYKNKYDSKDSSTSESDYKKYYDKYKNKYDDYKNAKKTFDTYQQKIAGYKSKLSDFKNDFLSKLNAEKDNLQKQFSNNFQLSIPVIKNTKIANAIIILTFILIVLILSFIFLPTFKDFGKLFNQISNVTYVVLYTIFIIILFRLVPKEVMDKNASYIVPITMVFAFLLFIISFQTNYVSEYNLNYERIKMIILYFCFITLSITYYSANPGKYITNNFNTSMLLSMILGILGFVYLIILFTLPITNDILKNSSQVNNILSNVSSFTKYGTLLFVLFIIVMAILISNYPGGFLKNKSTSLIIIPLLLLICIIWAVLLVSNLFSEDNTNNYDSFVNSRLSNIKKALLAIFGFSISGILIAYFVYSIQNLSGKKGITSFILSLFLIISILTLIYKTFFVQFPNNNINKKKNGFFEFIINILFYIPCLFSGILDTLKGGNIILLIMVFLMIFVYFNFSKVKDFLFSQGGKKLVTKPISTDRLQNLSNYLELNGSDKPDYQYSLCFSLYIDSNAPNTNPSYNKFTSVLNYGGKPNILYKADINTLMITMDQKDLEKNTENKLLEFDENGNRIIFVKKNFLLQKWNNFVINYNGGILDIFLNGELVKSSNGVIPYQKLDLLTVGSDSGIKGGINDVVYYKNPLSLSSIYYISM